MAEITYPWNPFQERIDCRITDEVIKTSSDNTRKVFVPRAAPFYPNAPVAGQGKKFILKRQGSNTELVPGEDFVYAHDFSRFINRYSRNVFGAVVLLKDFPNEVLVASYDTIGGPFILDDAAFVKVVGDVLVSPRTVDWSQLVNVPAAFPADPHEQPLTQTYDWLEMYTALKSLITVLTNTQDSTTVLSLLEEHMNKRLPEAHPATKADLGLPSIGDLAPAKISDLAGNSPTVAITAEVLKEAFRRYEAGTLDLN